MNILRSRDPSVSISLVHPSASGAGAGDNLIIKNALRGNRPSFAGESQMIVPELTGVDISLSSSPVSPSPNNESLPNTRIKRNYSCSKCAFFTQNPRTHLYHYRDVHGDKGNIYECTSCIYASKHSQKLQRHIRMCHDTSDDKYQGDDDDAEVRSGSKSESDEFEGEGEQGESQSDEEEEGQSTPQGETANAAKPKPSVELLSLPKPQFRCKSDGCSYVTADRTRYKKHVNHHNLSSSMVACTICDFSTPYKWNLDRHLKNHTSTSTIQCPICSFSADNKQSVNVHIQSHHLNLSDEKITELLQGIALKLETGGAAVADNDNMDETDSGVKNGNGNGNGYESLPILFDERTGVLADRSRQSFIDPEDILEKNGKIYFKKLKCPKPDCGFRAVWETELNRHMSRAHAIPAPRRLMPTLQPITPPKRQPTATASPIKMTSVILPKPKAKAKSQQALSNYPRNRSTFLDNLSQRLQKAAKAQVRTKTALKGLEMSRLARKQSVSTAEVTQEVKVKEVPVPEVEVKEVEKEKPWDDMTGIEVSPGLGLIQTVHHKNADAAAGEFVEMTRRVFKCPHEGCKFWASTPARFHVHIIDHAGTKPFHCSSCPYNSNWSWDVTKHIRLRSVRDAGHVKARVVVTKTETGEENHKDYGKYVSVIKIMLSPGDDVGMARARKSKSRSPPVPSPPQQQQSAASAMPKMPKLIRAPNHAALTNGNISQNQNQGQNRQPGLGLPALKEIRSSSSGSEGRTFVEKNMLSGGQMLMGNNGPGPRSRLEAAIRNGFQGDEGFPPLKRAKILFGGDNANNAEETTKRWKCKMCAFRNEDKAAVVAHIRQFHKKDTLVPNKKTNGHGQGQGQGHSSGSGIWGDETLVPSASTNERSQPNKQLKAVQETHQYTMNGSTYHCKFCPFKIDYLQYMLAHSENHFSKASHQFSCGQCSFSVATESALKEHVALHAAPPSPPSSHVIRPEETPPRPTGSGSATHKKYHCTECPYVTDSRGQFQYHRQFHVTRADSPFKCEFCSYCVSHKHLLHQHSRVHSSKQSEESEGQGRGQSESPSRNDGDEFESDSESTTATARSTTTTTNHPSILMWRDGVAFKVYRCPSCPHFFEEVEDLVEHEKTHLDGYEQQQQQMWQQQQQQRPKAAKKQQLTQHKQQQPFVKTMPKNHDLPLSTCRYCPARFFNTKELVTHTSFHRIKSPFKCPKCTYSVKTQTHLDSHTKVHGMEYQKTTVEFSLKSNKIKCPKCPARLPNEPSFQQHYGFHGRDFGFNCSSCDFGAESAHALMLHEFIHEIMAEKAMMKSGMSMSINTVPMRGQGQGQGQQYVPNITISPKATTATPSRRVYKPDDEACEGNPEFNYPTYVKNGKMKEKRYKCKKCPSAFEKRDQYNVHMGLHGSEQRYKCTICDYSVTYYANFAQHLKKHQSQPEIPKELLEALATPLSKLVTSNTAAYRCTQCPYYSNSQNEVVEHEGQHGRTSPGLVHCQFCDFAVGDNRALDRHIKFHFQNSPPSSFLYGSNENDQKNDEDDGDEDEDEGQSQGQGQTAQQEQQENQKYVEMLKHLPIDMYEDEEEEEQGQGQGHDDFEDEDEDDDGME